MDSEQERISWVQLCRSQRIGPVTFFKLIETYGTATAALKALPDFGRDRKQPFKIYPRSTVEAEIKAHEKIGAHLIMASDAAYPQMLSPFSDRSPVLSVRGNLQLLNQPAVAIVGARNACINSQHFAQKIARELSEEGFVILSGLARGIDAAAHRGAMNRTIAVLPGGVDILYPPENKNLYDQLCSHGAVISEAPLHTSPKSIHFPKRNRIISGMAQAVVVVQAARRSGTLITAEHALDQGKEILVVPGAPWDPRSEGSNHLIRQGAQLVQSTRDILNSLKGQIHQPSRESSLQTSSLPLFDKSASSGVFSQPKHVKTAISVRQKLLENLGATPIRLDDLARECHVSSIDALRGIQELELEGAIVRQPGNLLIRHFKETETKTAL